MITRHIADLLYHNECVIVPGLGGFIKAFNPARILHTTHEFYPPSGSVAFNSGLKGNDGLLANYISSVENISYREALNEIHLWLEKCNEILYGGDKLVLDGLGDLFLNASGKIEFKPSKAVNFNADSFGLPVFFARTTDAEPLPLPAIKPVDRLYFKERFHRIIPETLKWAAVLAPFVAFVLWGSLNGNIVQNYVHNYTGMFSWVRSTPGKTATVEIGTMPEVSEKDTDTQLSPAEILVKENIPYNPNVVSYAELTKHNITIASPETISTSEPGLNLEYHVVGGAFRNHDNAMNLIASLKEQGYQAAIVDTTPGGLYVVSMISNSSYEEAATQLKKIKEAGYTSSWILRKHRG